MRRKQLDVTDDVSIVEALGRPVKVTTGSYTNIKVVASIRKYGHRHLCFQDMLSAQFATILGCASVACYLNCTRMLLGILCICMYTCIVQLHLCISSCTVLNRPSACTVLTLMPHTSLLLPITLPATSACLNAWIFTSAMGFVPPRL